MRIKAMTMSNSMSEKPAGAVAQACRPAGRRELSAEQRAMFRSGFTPPLVSEPACAGNANLRPIQAGQWVEQKAGRIHALGFSVGASGFSKDLYFLRVPIKLVA
jgi:hypothetical protein